MRNSRQHFPDYEQRAPITGNLGASGQRALLPVPAHGPESQPSIRRSMRKNVRAMAPAADFGATRLRRGPRAPLIGLYLREYVKLNVGVRDSHEPCQTVN
jgi:hypothetical protein